MPLAWTKPTQVKPTVESPDDPCLGWDVQYDKGPTHMQAYAPWVPGRRFTRAADVVDPTAAPTASAATTGGTLAAGTYSYAYALASAGTETLVSPVVSQTTTGATSVVTVTVPAVVANSWYDRIAVYRSVAGVLLRVGTTTTTSFVDDGSATPNASSVGQTVGASKASVYAVNH